MTRDRGPIDWAFVPHALADAAPTERAPEPASPGRAPDFAFRRPAWQCALALLTPVWFLVPMLLAPLVRVWLGRDEIVIARGGDLRGRRIARADVVGIRRRRGELAIVVRDAAPEPLTPAGTPRRADLAIARALAHALAVPFVDATGAAWPLPIARLVRATT
jgi:hypothetical protein